MRALLLLLALGLSACTTVVASDDEGPLSFRVTLTGDPAGLDPASPLPFSTDGRDIGLRIEAVARDGSVLTDFAEPLTVHLTPGDLLTPERIGEPSEWEAGVLETTIRSARAYRKFTVWVSHEGTDESPGTYATGAAPPLYIDLPTIAQVQQTDDPTSSDFERKYVPVKG